MILSQVVLIVEQAIDYPNRWIEDFPAMKDRYSRCYLR